MKAILLLMVSVALLAQPTYTTIDDIVYTPVSGVLFTGTLQVSNPTPLVATGGASVAQWRQTVPVYAGIVRLQIVANDTYTTPGTSYVFRFTPSNGTPFELHCTIPTSGSPVKLSTYCSGTPYSPPPGISGGGMVIGPWSANTCPTCMVRGNNLSDISSAPAARANLGLAPIAATGAPADLTGAGAAGHVLRSDGTHYVDGAVQAGDIPNLPESQVTGLVGDLAAKAASNAATNVNGQSCQLGGSCTITAVPGPHAATHASAGSDPVTLAESQIMNLGTDLAAKAPLASPALTGTPTAPTAAPGTNTTQVASTAYADAGLALKVSSSALGVTVATLDGSATVPQAQLPRCVRTVTFSSTPAFDFSLCPNQTITLTGNVSPTISNAAYCERGCRLTFVQGVGSYTVSWPGSVAGGFTIGTANGGKNSQGFSSLDGTTLNSTDYGTIDQ